MLFRSLFFLIAGTVRIISTKTTSQLIVYNTQGYMTVGIREGNMVNLYTDSCFIGQEVKKHSSVLSLKPKVNVVSGIPTLIKACNKRILITENVTEKVLRQAKPDILILSGERPVVFRNVARDEKISTVVISPEALTGFRLPVKSALGNADTVHYVRRDGAFYFRL